MLGLLLVCICVCIVFAVSVYKVCILIDQCFSDAQENPLLVEGRLARAGRSSCKPVVYIVTITSVLGRLPLVPVGDHGFLRH